MNVLRISFSFESNKRQYLSCIRSTTNGTPHRYSHWLFLLISALAKHFSFSIQYLFFFDCEPYTLCAEFDVSYDRGKAQPNGVHRIKSHKLSAFFHLACSIQFSFFPSPSCAVAILILICFFAHYYNFVSVAFDALH